MDAEQPSTEAWLAVRADGLIDRNSDGTDYRRRLT
ncbi:hypothetical protein BH10ACT6_BH10ACT6_06780 [soil metagenome]